jgi:hypothetical protein
MDILYKMDQKGKIIENHDLKIHLRNEISSSITQYEVFGFKIVLSGFVNQFSMVYKPKTQTHWVYKPLNSHKY